MRTTTTITIALLALATLSFGQTTGWPNFNDYMVNGWLSNSTSCTAVTLVSPTPLILEVSCSGAYPVILLFDPNPCTPNAIPMLTCQGTTLDILYSNSTIVFPMGTASPGGDIVFTAAIPLLTTPVTMSTQAVILDPACGPFPLFSQAYDLTIL